MWVLGLLPGLVVLALIAGGIALIVRGRGRDGWGIEFPAVLLGYCAIAMLTGVFMFASGGALLMKAGFTEVGARDFSYRTETYESYGPQPGIPRIVDPSDAAIRDDIATGISLTSAGAVLFALHAAGAALLRRRGAPGQRLISRAYNTIGLATATLAFLIAGGQALDDVVRRYVVSGDAAEPWQLRHPGDQLSIAVAMLPPLARVQDRSACRTIQRTNKAWRPD